MTEAMKRLERLIDTFSTSLSYYKDAKNNYNEHSCRIEYIDPLLEILGWDVANKKGIAPQYREVIAENYSTKTDRPDYTMALRGVAKFFVEAKKPAVDITKIAAPAYQTKKYGWNANHKIAVLTNFEYLAIYDTRYLPKEGEACATARYKLYHYTKFIECFDEISSLLARESVYSGNFDKFLEEQFPYQEGDKKQIDGLFLEQINAWRLILSNELHKLGGRYASLDVLNDVVQEFINQIVFLRICEDKNLPIYQSLKEVAKDDRDLHEKFEALIRTADRKYNSGIFSGNGIISDISNATVLGIIEDLYYPKSPYLFNIIEPSLLGKIYEMFLTEQLIRLADGSIGLAKKKDCKNRSVVTTPIEIVRYMVEKALSKVCKEKTPSELLEIRVADISCGSGVFLEEAFSFLQNCCIEKYIELGQKDHLIEVGDDRYKLPLDEKKRILCSCIYGIDIDVHAVEVAKFSLLLKLLEDETSPSVAGIEPILPNLDRNICFGNALINPMDLRDLQVSPDEQIEIAPFDWASINDGKPFDIIIGNPPYVQTREMHSILPAPEFAAYKKTYKTPYKQFDKYFLFVEQAITKIREDGYVCYIIPNKFFKIGSGKNLRDLIARNRLLVAMDDFGDAQLFSDKTIYSAIILLQKKKQESFSYSAIDSVSRLWANENIPSIVLPSATLNQLPWRLTTDLDFLSLLKKIDAVSVPLSNHVQIFNGIQTSAERPKPIYWFSADEIVSEDEHSVVILRDGKKYSLEKALLRPFFKPSKKAEKGQNSYSFLQTDKQIIFPYDAEGHLIPIDEMKSDYPGVYSYLCAYYNRLVPKGVSQNGTRDVPNATPDTWYQYGRTQALTVFTNTPKLIVGVLSKEPMYALDQNDMLIASGGTAGYCAISKRGDSPYALEYVQAWLSHPITERILEMVGSDFENGFYARGTFVLPTLPFVELDLHDAKQKNLYMRVVEAAHQIYDINDSLSKRPSKRQTSVLQAQKNRLALEIQNLIEKVYRLDF